MILEGPFMAIRVMLKKTFRVHTWMQAEIYHEKWNLEIGRLWVKYRRASAKRLIKVKKNVDDRIRVAL